MTTLAIMATYEKKRLKCYGTVAAGEHVAVTVTDGAQWIGEGTALRLRVLFGPDTVAVFPFAEGETWTATGTQNADAHCELNLNTLQAEKYLKHGGTCLWILDDVENHTLYATGEFDVLPWPKRRGIDEPIDLDGYPLLLDEINGLREEFEAYQQTVSQMLAAKQNTIFDLATIRSGAAAGATAVQPAQIARFVDDAEYKAQYGEQNKPAILFKHGTNVIVALDATPFVRDGMVSDVKIVGGNLVITFNTDAGQEPISIPLTAIFDPENYYDKTVTDNKLSGKADKSDLDPLLFAQYYPDGSVKSAAEFTAGIKYDDPDTTNRTITVKPFCDTGTAADDNSSLEGRVVIPPFVDAQGNPYISDDGTRFKVVGVSGGISNDENANLTAVVAPNTVTSIEDHAFDLCAALASVSLPAATTIVSNAFSFCTSLDSVDFGDTPRSSVPSLGNSAFYSVPTSCKIIVPYTQYNDWIAADGWKDLPQEFVRHAEKADKPATFTTGNLAKFDSNGNPVDSGKKPSDFQSALSDAQLANIAAVSDALAFDATHTYAAGDPVVYNGTLYTFTATHTGAWTGSDVSAVDIIARLAGKANAFDLLAKLDSISAAPAFSSDSSVSYAIGAHVTYNGKLYVCTTATTGGTWVAGSWDLAVLPKLPAAITPGNLLSFGYGSVLTDSTIPVANVATKGEIRYTLPETVTAITSASSEVVSGETVYYGEATLADRKQNQVVVLVELDELRVTIPPAVSGKVRDFGLLVGVGLGEGTALAAPALVPVAPTGETITMMNAEGEMPTLADGTTTASGVTVLYFTEVGIGTFLVKGEQIQEVA